MKTGTANLRISYIGGGYDFPKFFEFNKVSILSEGLPIRVTCQVDGVSAKWDYPAKLFSGLGSSAARYLSFLRARFPYADFREIVEAAICMDNLQYGGWQDAIASAYDGIIKIVLERNDWSVYPIKDLELAFASYRKLYKIPVGQTEKRILTAMQCRSTSFVGMQELVRRGTEALLNGRFEEFGLLVKEGWTLKKSWHPDISNSIIEKMEAVAMEVSAWGWKVCGAGGQGYFLLIADPLCHKAFQEYYQLFEV
jgi:D-glycero-alpha-D-manno-heptose-7-phosphate kinase